MRALFVAVMAVLLSSPALGQAPGLVPEGMATVVEVIDGDTVVLDDGAEVRLVGLQAPKLALGRRGFVEWPLADEAKDRLEDLVLDRTVTLAFGGRHTDRHGRLLAHLVRDDGLWVQQAMLEAGMARVYSFPDNRTAVAELLAAEARARADGVGIWADSYYAILSPEEAAGITDSYELVEGTVEEAARVNGRVYLNFGADYRQDFTVSIAPGDVETFLSAGLDPTALEGRRIRVRGWLHELNGPMIDATHPEQIEILD